MVMKNMPPINPVDGSAQAVGILLVALLVIVVMGLCGAPFIIEVLR
jgi:hypothetical protein